MRISDWSSDVCSSDLRGGGRGIGAEQFLAAPGMGNHRVHRHHRIDGGERVGPRGQSVGGVDRSIDVGVEARQQAGRDMTRSEEHTSELQSLMRISYAVFCLKKQK